MSKDRRSGIRETFSIYLKGERSLPKVLGLKPSRNRWLVSVRLCSFERFQAEKVLTKKLLLVVVVVVVIVVDS